MTTGAAATTGTTTGVNPGTTSGTGATSTTGTATSGEHTTTGDKSVKMYKGSAVGGAFVGGLAAGLVLAVVGAGGYFYYSKRRESYQAIQ